MPFYFCNSGATRRYANLHPTTFNMEPSMFTLLDFSQQFQIETEQTQTWSLN